MQSKREINIHSIDKLRLRHTRFLYGMMYDDWFLLVFFYDAYTIFLLDFSLCPLRRSRIAYLYTVSKHIKQFHTRYKLTYILGTWQSFFSFIIARNHISRVIAFLWRYFFSSFFHPSFLSFYPRDLFFIYNI